MISVIFCSRVKDNLDSNVKRMLDSALVHVRPDERDRIEFLIKYDDDDEQRPADSFLAQYPFRIRTFDFTRPNGELDLQLAPTLLGPQKDLGLCEVNTVLPRPPQPFPFCLRPPHTSDHPLPDELALELGDARQHVEA